MASVSQATEMIGQLYEEQIDALVEKIKGEIECGDLTDDEGLTERIEEVCGKHKWCKFAVEQLFVLVASNHWTSGDDVDSDISGMEDQVKHGAFWAMVGDVKAKIGDVDWDEHQKGECEHCGETLDKSDLEYHKGEQWCSACVEAANYFDCDACGGKFHVDTRQGYEGKDLCAACYAKAIAPKPKVPPKGKQVLYGVKRITPGYPEVWCGNPVDIITDDYAYAQQLKSELAAEFPKHAYAVRRWPSQDATLTPEAETPGKTESVEPSVSDKVQSIWGVWYKGGKNVEQALKSQDDSDDELPGWCYDDESPIFVTYAEAQKRLDVYGKSTGLKEHVILKKGAEPPFPKKVHTWAVFQYNIGGDDIGKWVSSDCAEYHAVHDSWKLWFKDDPNHRFAVLPYTWEEVPAHTETEPEPKPEPVPEPVKEWAVAIDPCPGSIYHWAVWEYNFKGDKGKYGAYPSHELAKSTDKALIEKFCEYLQERYNDTTGYVVTEFTGAGSKVPKPVVGGVDVPWTVEVDSGGGYWGQVYGDADCNGVQVHYMAWSLDEAQAFATKLKAKHFVEYRVAPYSGGHAYPPKPEPAKPAKVAAKPKPEAEPFLDW